MPSWRAATAAGRVLEVSGQGEELLFMLFPHLALWLFGGVSELSGDAPRPSAEAWIAGVGPLTSLLLGGIFTGLAALADASHPARASIAGVIYFALVYLGVTNVMLAVFNVIPAAPLDGGRVLRAIVWWRTGDRVKATVWAQRHHPDDRPSWLLPVPVTAARRY